MIFLCYHGVTINGSIGVENFSKKHISAKEFYNQMLKIKKNYNILNIEQIFYHLKNKKPFKKKSVSISFDDGFKNNFTVALPILKKLNIPAIFYICPQSITKQEMFWVDKIEACINHCKKKIISINLNKRIKNYSIEKNDQKKSLINRLKKICKKKSVKDKNKIIKDLINQTGIEPKIKFSKNYEIANWKQIKLASKNKLFTIGGHSMEHDILTNMNDKEINYDIKETKKIIENKIGKKVKHFSYPEGKFNDKVMFFLKKNKILTCPLASGYRNNHLTSPYKIKRVMVGIFGIKFPLN